jgi:integrase
MLTLVGTATSSKPLNMATLLSSDVVLWKRNKSDSKGTVSLRVTKGKARSYKSLSITIPEADWNERTQRVRASNADADEHNATITRKLAELAAVGNKTKDVAAATGDFLSYCETFISSLSSLGTRNKYGTILNKLRGFLRSRNEQGLAFADVNPELIRQLQQYLLKHVTRNVANNYMKVFNRFLKAAIKERKYNYDVNPFISIEYTNAQKSRKTLSERDIKSFRTVTLPERLQRAQRAFIVQLLAQGMRVSDLLLLRWSDITSDGINYTMYKTGKEMNVHLNDILVALLVKQAEGLPPFKQHRYIQKLTKELAHDYTTAINAVKLGYDADFIGKNALNMRDFKNVPEVENYLLTLDTLRINQRIAMLDLSKTKHANEFVFSFLKTADFPTHVTSINIEESQYKKMHSAKIVYNRHLKEIQALAKIEFQITSHAARHAYTNLLLTDKDGYDVYDISRALGHSSLKVTESYIGSFSKSHVGKINEAIAKRLTLLE